MNLFAEYVFEGSKQADFHRDLQSIWDEHMHSSCNAPVEHGKTTQAMIRCLFELSHNPNHMIAWISNAPRRPREVLMTIKHTIESNPRYKELFPNIKLIKATRDELVLERDISSDAGPSFLAIGIRGSSIGSRFTIIVLDDIQDFDNTYSEVQRRNLITVLESTVLNRLAQNGRLLDIGTPWTWDDARSWLQDLPGFHFATFDAEDLLWPDLWKNPLTGTVWGWPKERLEKKKTQISKLEWDRQYRCMPLSGSVKIFDREDVYGCIVRGLGPLGRASAQPIIVSGVDLAIDKKSVADQTIITTVAPFDGKKELLDIRVGHWELSEIIQNMLHVVCMYPTHRGFRTETNAAQMFIKQAADNPEVMRAIAKGMGKDDDEVNAMLQRLVVIPHTTTTKKFDPEVGIRSMAVDFEQRRWLIPSDDNGVLDARTEKLLRHLTHFNPVGHTSDYVMSAWLASEEARRYWSGGEGSWESWGFA